MAGFRPKDEWAPVEQRAPLTARQLERMLGIALRQEAAMKQAAQVLSADVFSTQQRGYALVWSVAKDFYEEHLALPGYDDIVEEVERRLMEGVEEFSDEELELLDNWLQLLYAIDEEVYERPATTRVFRKYLRMFLEDRAAEQIREDFFDASSTLDIYQYLQQLGRKAQKIQQVEESDIEPLFAEGWSAEAVTVELRDTTLPFLNGFLDGGDGIEEVSGLVAPFGTCKTTFAVQMCAGRARKCRQEWLATDRQAPLGIVYLFIYEGSLRQIRVRALSFAAQIHRSKLKDLRTLNPPGVYDDYERILFADMFANNVTVPCERQRVRVVQAALNDNLRVVCMSGMDRRNPGRGTGYVEEIARIVETDLAAQKERLRTDVFCETVVVDYVGAAVERAALANDWSEGEIRRRTERFPYQLGQQVAMPFRCPVWVLHQLSGKANSLAPGRIPKGTDVKDTKSFKENLDFLIVVGSKNKQDLCCWSVDKARRFETNPEPEIVFVDGALSTLRSASGEYVLDRHNGEIVPASELHGFNAAPVSGGEEEYDSLPAAAEIQANELRRVVMRNRR